MTGRAYSFTHAITRKPCAAIIDGLRAVDTGAPSLDVFERDHADYVAALQSTGATVVELPADEAFPDSVFVEDTALCLPELAIVMRPGAPTRLGEAAEMAPNLRALYGTVAEIAAPGRIEGGDILVTEREVLVGTSARTDLAGVSALKAILSDYDYSLRVVETPPEILHFKTDCSLLDEETILTTPALARTGCFEGYKTIFTGPGEEAAANAIRFNELVILPAGFPKTAERLDSAGYRVKTIGNTEAAKLDGGMSCLSLRFSPS